MDLETGTKSQNANGRVMHQPPEIPGFVCDTAAQEVFLRAGTALSLVVIANQGGHAVRHGPDNWNVTTADGKRSVLFTQVVVVSALEPVLITAARPGLGGAG